MKKLLLLLCLLCPLLLLPSGCSSNDKPTAEAVVYQTLKDTWTIVDHAMQGYGIQVRAGKVSEATQAKIDAAHEKFRLSFLGAVKLAKHNWLEATPQSVSVLAAELLALIPTN